MLRGLTVEVTPVRLLTFLLLAAAATTATAQDQAVPRTALVIHGGAGVIERASMGAEAEREIRAALEAALDAGHAVLAGGGSALDAVEAAVVALEEEPRFNAGKGAVFNAEGRHELDASVMYSQDRQAGAVAAVTTVRNPVRLARRVMEQSEHVMLIGDGAERFADDHADLERVENTWFDTEARRGQLERARQREEAGRQASAEPVPGQYFGTVGAVALDAQGRIAAATSTGGMTNKRWGRVGDAPIIGAGTWADAHCGVSATGWGEFFIRNAVAHDICARMAYGGDSLQAAADAVVMQVIPAHGGDGGVIALDGEGNIALPFNTAGMYRGWVAGNGSRGVAIFADED